MVDNSITFSTELDNKQLEKEYTAVVKKIDNLNGKLQQKKSERLPIVKQAEELGVQLDLAKAKLAEMETAQTGAFSARQIADQKEDVASLQKRWNAAQTQVERYDSAIQKAQTELERAEGHAGELAAQLCGVGESGVSAFDALTNRLAKFEKRIVGLAKRVFVFSLITMALRNMRTWLGNAVKANSDATAAIARLKGALLTLAQPLVQVVIPAFITLVNVLTQIVTAVASLFAQLSGKTLQQSADAAKALNDEQNAIKGVGSAAKKAAKSLAGFDEINKLTANDAGGAASSDIAPTFDLSDMDTTMLGNILEIVELIGAALAGWSIGKALGLDLAKTLVLMVAIYAIVQFVKDIFDMWVNGVSMDKLGKALVELAIAAAALGFALGPVAAGIALVVGGLALLATGIHDAMKSGMNWANTLTMIAGILATGLGLSILTGSLIPLFVAGILGALLAIVQFAGHGEELMEGLRTIFEGFAEFLGGVFSGDVEKAFAGLEKMGQGFKSVWSAIVNSVKDAWASFVQWFDEKTNGQFHYVIETVEKFVSGMAEAVKQILHGIIEFIEGVFTQDWDKAWQGLKDIFRGVVNGIITIIEGMINLIISGINALNQGIASAMGSLLDKIPDWVPVIGGKSFSPKANLLPPVTLPRVPALAQGAVIPPNSSFLAVLGDQTSGNNIEAPEAALQAMADRAAGANTALLREIVQLMKDGRVLVVDDMTFAELSYKSYNNAQTRHGGSLVSVRSGV